GCELSGYGDPFAAQSIASQRTARYHHWPVALAKAGAGRQQHVAIRQIRITVEGHRSNVVDSLQRSLIQRLDVLQDVFEAQTAGRNLPGGQRVEHKSVVGIWAVRQLQVQ